MGVDGVNSEVAVGMHANFTVESRFAAHIKILLLHSCAPT